MFAEGAIDASQLRSGTSNLRVTLSGIDSQLADAARTDPVAGLIAERDKVQARWDACSPEMQGRIIDELVTVTILPIPQGSKTGSAKFNPDYVQIDWKR